MTKLNFYKFGSISNPVKLFNQELSFETFTSTKVIPTLKLSFEWKLILLNTNYDYVVNFMFNHFVNKFNFVATPNLSKKYYVLYFYVKPECSLIIIWYETIIHISACKLRVVLFGVVDLISIEFSYFF